MVFLREAPADIATVGNWLALYEQNAHPRSENINWLTWKQSAEFLLKNLPIIAPAAKQ